MDRDDPGGAGCAIVAHQRGAVVGVSSGSGRQGRLLVLGQRRLGTDMGARGGEAGPADGVLEGQPQRDAGPSPEKTAASGMLSKNQFISVPRLLYLSGPGWSAMAQL